MIPALTESLSTYTGNDIAYQFSFYFRAVKDSDILVKATVGVALPVTLVLNVDYTYVASAFPLLGGTVTLINAGQTWMNGLALKLNSILTIQYNLSPSQLSDIKGSPVLLEVQKALDKLTLDMLAVVHLVNTDTAAIAAFPSLATKAGKLVQVNASETGFEYSVTAQTLLDAETSSAASAAAALVSKNAAAISETSAAVSKASTAADVVSNNVIKGQVEASVAQASGHSVDANNSKIAAAASAVSAAAQAALATTKAVAAAASAVEADRSANLLLHTSIIDLTFANSPYTTVLADKGKLFRIDCSGGNFIFNLPAMPADHAWRVSVSKIDNTAQTLTIVPSGADTVESAATLALTTQTYGRTLYQGLFSNWTASIFIDNSASISSFGLPGNVGGIGFNGLQNILANGTIVPTAVIQQAINIQGNGGPQNANLAPFSANPNNGVIIFLIGQDDAKKVTIFHSDTLDGCLLKGDCYLGLNDVLAVVRNTATQRYNELFRSVH